MSLADAPIERELKVLTIKHRCGRLNRLGVFKDSIITIISKRPFRGPLLIKIKDMGAQIVMGYELSLNIMVDIQE